MHLYEQILLFVLLKITLVADTYTLRCPTTAEWNIRANIFCRNRNEYYCLLCPTTDKYECTRYVTGGGYVEGCGGPRRDRQGFKKIIAGSFTREPCGKNRYQPIAFYTNEISDCIYEKSNCKNKGQVIFSNGTGKTDRLCSCNYKNGFTFVNSAGNNKYCNPSGYQDCSCYVKPCYKNNSLSTDDQCTFVASGVDTDFKNHNNNSKCVEEIFESVFNKIAACLSFLVMVILMEADKTNCCHEKCYKLNKNFVDGHNYSLRSLNAPNTDDSHNSGLENRADEENFPLNDSTNSDSGLHSVDLDGDRNELKDTPESEKSGLESVVDDEGLHDVEDFQTEKDQEFDDVAKLGQFKQMVIADWQAKDKKFVATHAAEHVLQCIKTNKCVTVTGSLGVGKTAIIRHVSLLMKKEGYEILSIKNPFDIIKLYQPNKKTLCVIDDCCGRYLISQIDFEKWKKEMDDIKLLLQKTCTKLIIGCRLQVYRDQKFEGLLLFKSCECNLQSEKLLLSYTERKAIAKLYRLENAQCITTYDELDCFPLLCSMCEKNQTLDNREFLDILFKVCESELDILYREGAYSKLCALALVVLFNNQLPDELLTSDLETGKRTIIKNTCAACKLNRGTSPLVLRDELNSLIDTFLKMHSNVYSTAYSRLFDIIAFYFAKHIIECMIKNANSSFIRERMFYQHQEEYDQFVIVIPERNQQTYIDRLLEDWAKGEMVSVFSNINMKSISFRDTLLWQIKGLDSSWQNKLANTIDIRDRSTVLIQNCSDGDINYVQWCIHQQVDLNIAGDDNVSPLYMACQKGHLEIVNTLLNKSVNINMCNIDGMSPLYIACQKGYIEILNILLTNKADINKCDDTGTSPLFFSCQKGHSEILKILLQNNADLNKCRQNGASPLFIACQKGHTDIVIMLLDNKADIDKCIYDGSSPLSISCLKGHKDIVKLLLDNKAAINKCKETGASPLSIACQQGHTEIVIMLLDNNADIDQCMNDGATPLFISCQEGHLEIVKLLLNNKADITKCNNYGTSPLVIACHNGYTEILNMLLVSKAYIDNCRNDV